MAHRRDQISAHTRTKGRLFRMIAGTTSLMSLMACSSLPSAPPALTSIGHSLFGKTGTPALTGPIGTVVTDEPQASLTGHDVLARGGNAVDAAVATATTLSVTLPSRASLGGGGACLVWRPGSDAHSFAFLPRAASTTTNQDRPAGTPATLRGLYLMHHSYGSVDFNDLLTPAITLANNGITVSHTLANDIAAVQTALFADDTARTLFSHDGTPLSTGDTLTQPRLASFLERLRNAGIGDLYTGALATVFANAAQSAGGALTADDLRQTLPVESAALTTSNNGLTADFTAPPADGGLGAALHYTTGAPAQGVVAAWRASGSTDLNTAQALLNDKRAGGDTLPALPASTSFTITDRTGLAVACNLSDYNLFGTGRIAGNTGVVLGASPAQAPRPLLPAAILHSGKTLHAVIAASGQNGAADAVGDAARAVANGRTTLPEGPGRTNAILCNGDSCHGLTDSRGTGLATGTTH
nr:gamma-glutamyltransferase [uncultured Neokomagataea sp.]